MCPPSESYAFASRRLASETIPPLLDRASPLRTSHFRDPGGPQIHFGAESFMDEPSLATNTDAVEFRMRYLSHKRDLAVVAEVEVNRNTGKVWARRFYVALDCRQVVSPDLLRQTPEAQIVQTANRALMD